MTAENSPNPSRSDYLGQRIDKKTDNAREMCLCVYVHVSQCQYVCMYTCLWVRMCERAGDQMLSTATLRTTGKATLPTVLKRKFQPKLLLSRGHHIVVILLAQSHWLEYGWRLLTDIQVALEIMSRQGWLVYDYERPEYRKCCDRQTGDGGKTNEGRHATGCPSHGDHNTAK